MNAATGAAAFAAVATGPVAVGDRTVVRGG